MVGQLITGEVVSAELDSARWYSWEICGVQQIPSLSKLIPDTPKGRLLTGVTSQLQLCDEWTCWTSVHLVWMLKGEKVVTLGHTLALLLLGYCFPMSGSVQ